MLKRLHAIADEWEDGECIEAIDDLRFLAYDLEDELLIGQTNE